MSQRIGKYLLTEELGAGGMGTVWKAFDESLQRDVALKLMHSSGVSDATRERFQVEARAIARLRSKHVVEVYDFDFTDDGRPFIVMELLRGETLGNRLARLGPLPLNEAIPIVVALCEGLEASHLAGIIHRDLKPQNVFLCTSGRAIAVKILDFGVAQMRHEPGEECHLTQDNHLPGTPGYMSPEQIQGARVDERSDLWALGVICYEMLCGRNPFMGPVFTATLLRIVSVPAPPVTTLIPGATQALDEFFARALAKAPEERFECAQHFGAALVELLEELTLRRTISVLVVDDEPDTCLLIEQSFEEECERGFLRFAFASSGAEALQWLSEHGATDVILTDLNMPRMDGLLLLERVLRLYPGTRSIVVTAYGDMGNVRKAMNRGAFDFLVKPIDLEDLASTVARAAASARDLQGALVARQENTALRQLVATDMVDTLLPRLRNFGGTVLYDDVGTVVCATLKPPSPDPPADALVEALNTHLDTITAVFERFGGVLARFHGEILTAVFRGEQHQKRAIRACLEARDATRVLTEAVPFRVTYGVETGELIAATVGAPSRKRFECSVLGPAARAALALSQSSRGEGVLVSGGTWHALKDKEFYVALECIQGAVSGHEAWSIDWSGSLSAPVTACRTREDRGLGPAATEPRELQNGGGGNGHGP